MPGRERLERPSAWIEAEGRGYCLACRHELAAEAALSGAPRVPVCEVRIEGDEVQVASRG